MKKRIPKSKAFFRLKSILLYVTILFSVSVFSQEIDLFDNATNPIAFDFSDSPSATNNTIFTSAEVGNSVTNTFTIENNHVGGGNGRLEISGISFSSNVSGYFSITSAATPFDINKDTFTTFTITFTPLTIGTFTADVTISNDDSNEDPYEFTVQGAGITPQPEIDITGLGMSIPDGSAAPIVGDDTEFGVVDNGTTDDNTFTILNTGNPASSLSLSGSPIVTISGDTEFSIFTQPSATPTTISGGNSLTFDVRFSPITTGSYSATISIANDDSDENPYTFLVQGSSIPPLTVGPGGVTTHLKLWLKANSLTGDGASVSTWSDQGRGADATVNTVGQEPTFKDNATDNVNFNPVIDFDNPYSPVSLDNDYSYDDTSTQFLEGTGGFYSQDIFMVVIPDVAVDNSFGSMDLFCGDEDISTNETDATGIGFGAYTIRFTDEVISYAVGTTNEDGSGGTENGYGVASTSGTYSNVGIINSRNNSDTPASQQELYYNGKSIEDTQNDVLDFTNVSDSRYWIGRSEGWEASTDARIAEIITYSSRKDDASFTDERNKILSYLAIKYGITLQDPGVNDNETDVNYVDSGGTTIWNATTNAGYNYDIAGIGRDDDTGLNQKQSKTVNTADDITMGLTEIATTNNLNGNTFATDKNFLVWGNDNVALTAGTTETVDMSSSIASLVSNVTITPLERVWKVVETGTVGTAKVSVPWASILQPMGVPPGDYLMFISDSPGFSPTAEYRVMTSPDSGVTYETDFDFPSNDFKYITFGFAPEENFVRSIAFDGTDDYLDSGDVLDLTASFTISAWINKSADEGSIVSKRDNGFTTGYDFNIDASGNLVMAWINAGTNSITSSIPIPNNVWHQVAVVYDGTDAKLYIDGIEDTAAVSTPSLNAPLDTSEYFRIATGGSAASYFEGNIDEVRVFDVALTESELRYIMNQEIEDSGSVSGAYFNRNLTLPSALPLPPVTPVIPTKNDTDGVAWANLQAYYPMSRYTFTNTKDESDNNYTAALKQITTVDFQNAPIPYVSSGASTDWDTNTTWTNGTLQRIPGAVSILDATKTIDWNIVQIDHEITMDNSSLPISVLGEDNRTLLGLVVNSNELTIDGTATTGNGLTVTHYLKLDGVLDLQGESQLIQTEESDLATSSSGYIEKDQQGTANSFTYNYWSSPVSLIGAGSNNTVFNVEDVLFDGTIPDDSTRSIDFGPDSDPHYSDGAVSDPIKITSYWLWKFVNSDNDYSSWQWIGDNNATLNVSEGFTMKGISNVSSIATEQNYVFIGKPNNVLNGDTQIVHTTFPGTFDTNGNAFTTLTGNPFPSAIDADIFIADNITSAGGGSDGTTGTLYFWEHWGGGTHNYADYQGGYATYTTTGGVAATSHPDVNQTGVGSKTPGQYIPVGQGFYVIQHHDDDGSGTTAGLTNPSSGSVVFNNGQRVFQKETGNVESVFTKNASTATTNSITTDSGKQRIWLGFDSSTGYHRQLLAGFLEGATDEIDRGYDGRAGDFLSNDAFFIQDDRYFVIQAFGEFNEEREIPISIFIDAENDNGLQKFMIDKLENIPDDVGIYIKDNLSGETHDIRNQIYEVNLATGEHKTRFSLVFVEQVLSVDEVELESGITVFMNNTASTINITKTIDAEVKKITLYNYIGQTIQTWINNLSNNEISLPVNETSTGAYILKIETENKTISKKLIIE